jgi:magnesium chelatase family protein
MAATTKVAQVAATMSSGQEVVVQVTVTPGLPAFYVPGAPRGSERELRERVRAGLLNTGFEFPLQRVVATVTPVPSSGVWNRDDVVVGYWIARALLAATDQGAAPSPIAAGALSIGGTVTMPTGREYSLRELVEQTEAI